MNDDAASKVEARGAASRARLLTAATAVFVVLFANGPAFCDESGAVLVFGADCTDAGCVVGSYGAGFVVGIDEESDAAHVLTARHVVDGFGRVYVLACPSIFSFEYAAELEAGNIPQVLSNAIEDMGYPAPSYVRRGAPEGGLRARWGQSMILQTESWILSGAGRDYVVLPREGRLALYHLVAADVVQESDPALDVALLVAYDFPLSEGDPILYMYTPASVPIGTAVTTFGCRWGRGRGVSLTKAQGTTILSEPGFLSYESDLVAPGFSGGPVIVGDYVAAMNLTQDARTGTRVNARLSSGFKDLVDSWIGLRRMDVDLFIQAPEGATDGIVSTDQEFSVGALAHLAPDGPLLAPIAHTHLDVPSPYTAIGSLDESLEIGQSTNWTISSPSRVTDFLPLRLYGSDSAVERDSALVAEILMSTEESIHIAGTIVKGPKTGARLFQGDDFRLKLQLHRTGQSDFGVAGHVRVVYAQSNFTALDGPSSRPLSFGEPVEWRLKPLQPSVGASFSFAADVDGVDRNGRSIDVRLPEPVTVRIQEAWGMRSYWGLGRLSLEGGGGGRERPDEPGKRSEGKSKGEMELGTKLRLHNIMQKGIPLNLILAGGFGLDDTWNMKKSSEGGSGEYLVADWRAWWGAGLSVELGFIELCADAGHIWFARYVDDKAPDEAKEDLSRDTTGSPFVRPGVEVALAPSFAVYAGARMILDNDDVEYYLQLRLCSGK